MVTEYEHQEFRRVRRSTLIEREYSQAERRVDEDDAEAEQGRYERDTSWFD